MYITNRLDTVLSGSQSRKGKSCRYW